jgi:hypothetical protein
MRAVERGGIGETGAALAVAGTAGIRGIVGGGADAALAGAAAARARWFGRLPRIAFA